MNTRPQKQDVEAQLLKVLESSAFANAERLKALLRYLVNETLAGNEERLKGYAIGVDVFERGEGFDPTSDSIVRVQVGRLRAQMEIYYQGEGRDDSLRFDIPKGGYTVHWAFSEQQISASPNADRPGVSGASSGSGEAGTAFFWRRVKGGIFRHSRLAGLAAILAVLIAGVFVARLFTPAPDADLGADYRDMPSEMAISKATMERPYTDGISLAVTPFKDMSQDQDQRYLAEGVTADLITALSKIDALEVARYAQDDGKDDRSGPATSAEYMLRGGIQKQGDVLRINVQLLTSETGETIWAETYNRILSDIFEVQDDIVTSVATEMRPQLYSAAKRSLEHRSTGSSSAWELYMRAIFVPGEAVDSLRWEKERVMMARRAVELDPTFGEAYSVLADKLMYLANVDPLSDTPELRREGEEYARLAMKYAPDSADAVFNMQSHYWHMGNLAAAERANRRVLDLDSNHLLSRFLIDVVPYTCGPAPIATIQKLEAMDAALSPGNPSRWMTLHWLSQLYVGVGDYAKALETDERLVQIFSTPDTVMRRAALLVWAGKLNEARTLVEGYRRNWPNFDPQHYLDAAISRRCDGQPNEIPMQVLYRNLAVAMEEPSSGK